MGRGGGGEMCGRGSLPKQKLEVCPLKLISLSLGKILKPAQPKVPGTVITECIGIVFELPGFSSARGSICNTTPVPTLPPPPYLFPLRRNPVLGVTDVTTPTSNPLPCPLPISLPRDCDTSWKPRVGGTYPVGRPGVVTSPKRDELYQFKGSP